MMSSCSSSIKKETSSNMAKVYRKEDYGIDFQYRDGLSQDDVIALMDIQDKYKPVDRIEYLLKFRAQNKITDDDLEKLTGIPYQY